MQSFGFSASYDTNSFFNRNIHEQEKDACYMLGSIDKKEEF